MSLHIWKTGCWYFSSIFQPWVFVRIITVASDVGDHVDVTQRSFLKCQLKCGEHGLEVMIHPLGGGNCKRPRNCWPFLCIAGIQPFPLLSQVSSKNTWMRLAEYVICACSTFHLVQNEVVCFLPQSQGTGTEKSPMLCRQRGQKEQERFDVVVAKANCGFKWSLWELWKHATMDRSWRFLNTLEPKLPQLQEEGLRCYKKMDCDATFSVDYDHYEDS